MRVFGLLSLVFSLLFLAGCVTRTGNVGNLQSFSAPALEAKWIRDGEPIEFEEALWYPADGIEGLMDSEVYHVGEYKGTQVFIDKLDVRPYERLYTKYGKNQFRYFEKEKQP
ncbi:MAG TPA: hypothetical protein DE315_00600 [Candidatus Omnitrophica bacterium]|nr:hypothetical protein [Candidatus Omnitrophota bacterium]HCI44022.1 hypothetical protein [Candidatus Omnitrophota bacterium]